MNRVLMTALSAAATVAFASPAFADVAKVAASSAQGTLVHGVGPAVTGTTVTADLGSNGPTIVNFNGTTTDGSNQLMLQNGSGQADVTGITISGNDTYGILSGNIYLTNASMQYIEFGLTSGAVEPINFVISAVDANGVAETPFNFTGSLGNGDTFFAFLASNGEAITNVAFSLNAGAASSISLIKQVRIDEATGTGAVPEPATWAMMLLGFGGIGAAMRRRRNPALAQIA